MVFAEDMYSDSPQCLLCHQRILMKLQSLGFSDQEIIPNVPSHTETIEVHRSLVSL